MIDWVIHRPLLPRQHAAIAAAGVGAIAAGALISTHPSAGLLVIAVVCGSVALLMYPEWATVAVVFAIFVNVPSVFVNAHGVPAAAVAVFPFLLLLPLAAALRRGERLVATPLLALLALFLLVEILSTVQAAETNVALDRLRTFMFEGLLTYALVTNAIRSRQLLRQVTWAVVAAGALLGGLALWQQVTHSFYQTYGGFSSVSSDFFYGFVDKPRLQGPIGDPNYFAQVLVVTVPLALLLGAGAATRARRFAATGCAALATAGIVLTSSRGAVVALAAVVLGLAVLGHIDRRHVFVLVLGLAISVALLPDYRHRVSSLLTVGQASTEAGAAGGADQSLRARSTEMRAAFYAFNDHPVLGLGPGNFPAYYQSYAAKAGGELHARVKFGPDKGSTPERQAHNIFLSVAADLGAVGLSVFAAILAVAGTMLLASRRRLIKAGDRGAAALAAGFFLALVGYVVCGLFLSLAYERYLWLLLALAVVAARVGSKASAGSERIVSPSANAEAAALVRAPSFHAVAAGGGGHPALLVAGGVLPLFSDRATAENVVAEIRRLRPDAGARVESVERADAWKSLVAAHEAVGTRAERRNLFVFDELGGDVQQVDVLRELVAAMILALRAPEPTLRT